MNDTLIAGVGMIPFRKPGASDPYDVMAGEVVREALADAGLEFGDIQQAYAGYVYGDSTAGQRALYPVGMTGIPIINVNNNCATGSTALFLARQAVEHGAAACVLALGFEQMSPGPLSEHWHDRPAPLGPFTDVARATTGRSDLPMTIQYFAGAGRQHMETYGTSLRTFAEIRAKASRHAACNPRAIFTREVTADEVLASGDIWPGVLTRMMACPPTCGAAAAILVSREFARRRGLNASVAIAAQAMTTDQPATFEGDLIKLVGFDLARDAAQEVYARAGIGPADVDVAELHDCFAQNELLSYEALGFCAPGDGERFVQDRENTYGGKVVANPSGGLLSKGHPLGATGLAQCFELTQQLCGNAGPRQVDGARWALQHNLGMGGACVVALYTHA